MKNNTKHQETVQKKMFFDSDGVNFFINLMIGILKVDGMLLVVLFNVICLILPQSKKTKHTKNNGFYYEDDNCLFDEDNQHYYK